MPTIRNTKIGGPSNWASGEVLTAVDQNETFDETIDRLQDLTTGHDHDDTDSRPITHVYSLVMDNAEDTNQGEVFTSDTATTKTNFTYDAIDDEYFATGTGTKTLITATKTGKAFNMNNRFGKGIVRWSRYVYTIFDECNNSSADTALWDVASTGGLSAVLSENTQRLFYQESDVSGASGGDLIRVRTKGASGNFKTNGLIVACHMEANENANGLWTTDLRITDGTNSVTFVTGSNADSIFHGFIKFDTDNNKALVYNMDDNSFQDLNISSITGDWRLQATISSDDGTGTGDADIKIFHMRRIQDDETTSIVDSFSSDAGTTFSNVSARNVASITNDSDKGTEMRAKMIVTGVSDEGVSVSAVNMMGIPDNIP